MGTRSRIGVMQGNECKSVYCHWDGYLSHNGAILQEHYDSEKINHLVSLGDLSTLRPEIGEKHPFSQFDVPEADRVKYDNWCTFYARDRGETDTDFKVTNTFAEFLELVNNCGAEYFYIMKDGVWYCGSLYAVDSMISNTLYVLQELLANETT